ncbi:phage tail tape measure protein [Clostridium sp. UBA2485]|uniref:phage tail tape measure protein n=1 Tax=Clostridium sp. UBA2485 TaxID=1946352 RepID=UPI0025C2A4F0|nr:phage tail tape measure protein [Clostridium sp. UBA2485]
MAGFKGYRRSIVLDFNYDSVKAGVSGTSKQMALLNSEFRKQMEQASKTGSAVDKLGLQYDHAVQKMNIQKDKVAILRQQLNELTNAENKNAKAIANKRIELNNAETAMSKMETEVKDLSRELEFQNTRMGQARTAAQDFSSSMESVGLSLDDVGSKMQMVGGIMATVGAAAIKFQADFAKNMAMARTIMDESSVSFKDMGKEVLQISADFNVASTEVAEGLYNTLSSGIQSSEAIGLLTDATRLSKVGFTENAVAVDILTTLINSYGLSVKDSTKLVDQLVKTQEVGKITVGELGESFGRIAGLAAQAQVPIIDLFAAIATMTQSGIDSAQAITGLRGILSAVINPTAEARKEAKKLGLQFNETALKTKGLSGFLEDVNKKTRGNTESVGNLFGNINALNGVLVLTGSGADMYKESMDKIANSTGFADQALEKITTPAEEFSAAVNRLKIKLTELGEWFDPVVKIAAVFVDVIAAIPKPLLAVVAIAGTLTLVLGSIAKIISSVSKMTGVFNQTFGGLNLTLAKTALIIIGVSAAIAGLLAMINILIGRGEQVNQTMNTMSNSMTGQADKMRNTINQTGQGAYRQIAGSHATGIKRVPRDRYVAELHEGEAVIPKSQNPYINGNGGFGGGDNIYITIDAKNVEEFNSVVRMAKEYKQTARAYGRG